MKWFLVVIVIVFGEYGVHSTQQSFGPYPDKLSCIQALLSVPKLVSLSRDMHVGGIKTFCIPAPSKTTEESIDEIR